MTDKQANFYLHTKKRVRLVTLLFICLGSISAQAVPLKPPTSNHNSLPGDWKRYADHDLDATTGKQLQQDQQYKNFARQQQQDKQYKKVIKLLKQGKRKQAKLALGLQLARQPDPHGYEMAGIIFLEDRDNKLALASFDKAISLDPSRISAHAERGVALLMLNKMAAGRDALLQVLKSQPDNALALRYLGWFQDIYGHPNSAIDFYLKLLNTKAYQSNALTTIHLEVARIYNQLGQNQKAIAIIKAQKQPKRSQLLWSLRQYTLFDSYVLLPQITKAASIIKQLENSPFASSPEVALRKATLAMATGKFNLAERGLRKLINTNTAYLMPASIQLARFKIDQKEPEQAIQILKHALTKESNDKQIKLLLRSLTELQVKHKQFADAKALLKKYIDKHPHKPYFGFLLFEVQLAEGLPTAAIKTMETVLVRSPGFADGWFKMGKLEHNLRKNRKAEKDFQRAISLDPHYIKAWIGLARLLFEEGREKEMESILKLSISKNQQNPQLPFELASLYETQHKSKQANHIYNLILQLYPNDVPSLNNLALNLAREPGHSAKAVKLANRAYTLSPHEAIPMATYGWVTLLSGNVTAALPLLEKAVKIEPKDMGIHHYLAIAYLKSGRNKKAEAQIKQAEKLASSETQKLTLKAVLTQIRSGHKFSDKELRTITY